MSGKVTKDTHPEEKKEVVERTDIISLDQSPLSQCDLQIALCLDAQRVRSSVQWWQTCSREQIEGLHSLGPDAERLFARRE